MKRDGKGLTTALQVSTSNYARDTRVYVRGDKWTRKKSEFTHELLKLWSPDARNIKARSQVYDQYVKAIYLRLEKKGRRYTSSVKFEPGNLKDPKKAVATNWYALPKLTSLRVPGDRFTLLVRTTLTDSYQPKKTEGLVNIDWIKIETGN